MKIALIVILVLVIGIPIASLFLVGNLARSVVENAGPKVLGVPIHLTDAKFDPLKGKISIHGFTMGNPSGYKTPESVGVGRATVEVKLTSLFRDPLVIDRIYVSNPRLTYELNLGSSNLQKIQDDVAAKTKAKPDQPQDAKQKKVIIRDLLVEKGEVHVAVGAAGNVGATLPLPTIHLTNVGEKDGGAAVGDVLGQISGQVLSSVGSVVGDVAGMAGDAAKEGVSAAGDAAQEGLEATSKSATKVVGKLGGLLGKDR